MISDVGEYVAKVFTRFLNQVRVNFQCETDVMFGRINIVMPEKYRQDRPCRINIQSRLYHVVQGMNRKRMADVMHSRSLSLAPISYVAFFKDLRKCR